MDTGIRKYAKNVKRKMIANLECFMARMIERKINNKRRYVLIVGDGKLITSCEISVNF